MKSLIIYKNCHYSNFIPSLICIKNKNEFKKEYIISFDDSCKYGINEKSCVNKLFGYSFGLFSIHKNSCRFGWSYDKINDNIIIWKYIYIEGKLYKSKFSTCNFNEKYFFSIKTYLNENKTEFNFNNEKREIIDIKINKKILLTLGFYFGGKTKAPHKMKINIF